MPRRVQRVDSPRQWTPVPKGVHVPIYYIHLGPLAFKEFPYSSFAAQMYSKRYMDPWGFGPRSEAASPSPSTSSLLKATCQHSFVKSNDLAFSLSGIKKSRYPPQKRNGMGSRSIYQAFLKDPYGEGSPRRRCAHLSNTPRYRA